MKKLMQQAALLALMTGGAAAQTPAVVQTTQQADDTPAGRDQVVVTARRREELVQDVPAAVTGLSTQQIEDSGGLKDVKDLSYLLPGLSFVDTGNINAENNIRGAGAGTARTAGVDSPIAVLRDGSSITGGTIGGRTFARQDLFDLARIEVTRGPQGALYGVNAVGGVMQAISQAPKRELGASVNLSYSPDIERTAIEAIGNVPLGDKMGLRVGIQTTHRDKGFFYNLFTKDYSDVEQYTGYKAAFEWNPTDDLRIFLVGDESKDTGASNFIRSVNRQNDATVAATTVGPADIDGPFVHSMNSSNETDREIQNYNGSVEWRTALGTLTSTSLYRQRSTVFRQDSDLSAPGYATGPFPAATCATRLCTTNFLDHTELTSEELRFAGDLGAALSYIVGANIQGRQSEFATVVDGRTTSAANLAPSPTANLSSTAKEEELQTGAFASLSWEATDRLTFDGAVRYNNSEKKTDAYTIVRGPATGPTACATVFIDPFNAPNIQATCLRTRNILEETFSTTAPSISAKYEISDTLRVFASAGIGYRAGGFNANSVLDPQITPTYRPEKNTAFEAGAKWEALGAFFTLTGFYNKFDDLLVTIDTLGPDLVSRNSRFNAGKANTYGVDFELFGFNQLGGGMGSIDYNGAINYLTGEIESGPYAGRTVEGSPEMTYTGTLTYRKPVFGDFVFVGSTSYRGQRGGYTNTTNINNQVDAPDLDLFNASIGLQNGRYRFTIEARNLFDETYESLRDPTRSVYGDPREIRFTLRIAGGSEERRIRGRR